MTPVDKVKYLVLNKAVALGADIELPQFDAAAIQEAYDSLEDWRKYDAENELRAGDTETSITSPWNRNYESKSVASQLPDGSWVGWTYWYGGGKHSDPDAIDWIGDAYDLDCIEEEKVVIVRNFTKKA